MSKKKTDEQKHHSYHKLNIVTMGGKGGVGKTTFMTALAEWFRANNIPVGLLDLDTENRTKGGLKFFWGDAARKVNVRERDGLDVFFDTLDREEAVVLADMGAGQGDAAKQWFGEIYLQAAKRGAGFLMVGLVTDEPASASSVLQWANDLQGKVNYLVVLNQMGEQESTFTHWHDAPAAKQFRDTFRPSIMTMASRAPNLQNHMSDHGLSLQAVIEGKAESPEFRRIRYVSRADAIRTQLFGEFARVIPPFLPDLD